MGQMIKNKVMDWCILISNSINFDNKQVRGIVLALCSTLHTYLFMFQVSINSIQKDLNYCRKTKL